MSPAAQARRGILLVVLASACFGALDTAAKYVSTAVPLVMAMWSRYLFQALVTGGVLVPRRGRELLQTRHPWLQALRGLMLVVSSSFAFLSLRFLPVGEYTAIMMLTPLVITLVAALSLGERVSWLRWALVAGGFSGALIVIRPGADDFRWAMLLPLAVVMTNAAFQLLTSRLVQYEDATTMHFYTGIVATALATLALPLGRQTPDSGWMWLMLFLLGLFSTLGHYLLILAYGHATPATLTPYLYTQIGFATLAGWLVFSHRPDLWAIVGIVVITACGVAGTWLTEHEQRRAGRHSGIGPIESRPFH